ncbi:MAG: hypothetical protein H0X43_01005 [Nitrosospira sp.]|nr:hypothetical protein [Nitrosospira sp.]
MIFSSTVSLNNSVLAAIANLLPYLDTALRRITPWIGSMTKGSAIMAVVPSEGEYFGFTERAKLK